MPRVTWPVSRGFKMTTYLEFTLTVRRRDGEWYHLFMIFAVFDVSLIACRRWQVYRGLNWCFVHLLKDMSKMFWYHVNIAIAVFCCILCCLLTINVIYSFIHICTRTCVGQTTLMRGCATEYVKANASIGCHRSTRRHHSVSTCFCATYRCNGGIIDSVRLGLLTFGKMARLLKGQR